LSAALGLTTTLVSAPPSATKRIEPSIRSDKLSLDRMIGEMIVVGFWGSDAASPGARVVCEWLNRGAVGGVIFFEDNLPSPHAAIDILQSFLEAAGESIPLLCLDQEGGAVARLRAERGFEPLPAARSVGTISYSAAEALYNRTARELHHLGFNANLGPVVDLALNPSNPVIEGLGRSYGTDPEMVIEYAKTFIDAHRRNRILTALKHFPGEGSAKVDTHPSLAGITATWSRDELRPFTDLTSGGYADMVMVGHLVHADLTEPGRPASLSPRAVQGLLRTTLAYDGVVVSDDMQMGALTRSFSPDDAILLGIEAGLDLFIYSNRQHPDPQMPARFHRVVRSAVESGRVPAAHIEESVRRISTLKETMIVEKKSWMK
jgi:beta-N-acetylhexosaminidase